MVRCGLRTHLWTPVGAGVKTEEEVDALALYLFGDGPEGRDQIREIDQTIAGVPGLEGMHLLEDYLDGALRRAAERPGCTRRRGYPRGPRSHQRARPAAHPRAQVGAVRADQRPPLSPRRV